MDNKNLFYAKTKYGETIIDKGFILHTDNNGNGEPYFSEHSKEGQETKRLWNKLNRK